jgi:hypothetical protein
LLHCFSLELTLPQRLVSSARTSASSRVQRAHSRTGLA